MNVEPLLSLRDVPHAFGEGPLRKTVLHGVNAELMAGEIVILTGPSGAGKTTILTLAGGLRRAQGGSVRVFGEELFGAAPSTLLGVRRRIGFIFQSPNLLDALTAEQNVALALAWRGPVMADEALRKARAQLALVGLEAHARKFPAQLSGGQRQRVAIARALVVEPRLILADEPTSAVDRTTGREIVELLHRLAKQQGCAIFLVTHDHRILDIADRMLALEDGRLVSTAEGVAQSASQLVAGVSRLGRRPDLARHVETLDETAFFRFLNESSSEISQLREVLASARSQLAAAQLNQLLEASTIKAGHLLQADRVTLFIVDWAARRLRSRVAQTGAATPLHIDISVDQGVAGFVARTGESVNLPDAYESPLFNPVVDQTTGYRTRSLLCVPARNRSGEIVFVGQALNKAGGSPFSSDDARRFAGFLAPIARLLEDIAALEAEAPRGAKPS